MQCAVAFGSEQGCPVGRGGGSDEEIRAVTDSEGRVGKKQEGKNRRASASSFLAKVVKAVGKGALGSRTGSAEERYAVKGILRNGDNSVVRCGISKSDARSVAIKTIKTGNLTELLRAKRELKYASKLARCNPEAFPKTYDTFCSADGSELSIVFELIEGECLDKRDFARDPMREDDAKALAIAVLSGVRAMHAQGLAHLDLKPSNLVAVAGSDPPKVKIIDFGMAMDLSGGSKVYSACGTPLFWAPEVVACQLSRGDSPFGMPADVWAVGVTLHVVLSGEFPFNDNRDNTAAGMRRLFEEIATAEPRFSGPAWSPVSRDAKDFLSLLLTKDAAERPTCAEALNHPWLRSLTGRASTSSSDKRRLSLTGGTGAAFAAFSKRIPSAPF